MKSTTILVLCAAGAAAVGLALLAVLSPARGSAEADGGASEAGDAAAADPSTPVRLDAAHTDVPELPVEPTLAAGRVAVTESEPVAEPPAASVPEPGPLVGYVVDYEGRDGVPGVIVQLACTDTKLREECQTDVTGRFETEANFALRSVTARVLDPEGGGIVGTFAWEWDAERLVMRGVRRKRSGALELPVAIGPTFVFDLRPRTLRSEHLRAHVVESWSAGALSGVLIRQTRREDYYLRQTPSAPGAPLGRSIYPGQSAGRRLGRSVVERGRRTVDWGSRPVRGEGPCWIRYGRGREPKGPGYEAHLEVEVARDRRVDQLELKTIRGVHPGVLSAAPRRIQDLRGTLENSWGAPVPGAVIGLLGPNDRPVFEGWATTDTAGGFTFQDAVPGDYKAVIVAEPLAPLQRSIRAGEFGEPDPSPLKIRDLVGPVIGETGAPPHIGGRAWCAHGEKLLVELIPQRDGQRRERRLLAPDHAKRGERGPTDASDSAAFIFANLPEGQYELVLSPVSNRTHDHPGMRSRVRVTPPAMDLELHCGTGAGELLHYLQVVRAEAETLDPQFDPRAAFGPRGPLTDPTLRLGPTDAVLLGEYPVGAPLEALAWSKGYRPVFLGPKAFERDKQTGLAAVARAELQRGWGARLFFLDASSLVSEDLSPDEAMAAMRKWRRNASEAVLAARPLEGVLLLDDSGLLARSDANGIAWLVGDAQPTRIDLFLPGWRATQIDRSGIGGPLRTDVVWMVPD